MLKTIQAGLSYFAIVFGTGFILGAFRVSLLVPRIGERWAELAEMPLMAIVIFWAAGFILRHFEAMRSPMRALVAGLLALAMLMSAELTLATLLQGKTLGEYIGSRDKVSGSVYLALLLVFAAMPRLRLKHFG